MSQRVQRWKVGAPSAELPNLSHLMQVDDTHAYRYTEEEGERFLRNSLTLTTQLGIQKKNFNQHIRDIFLKGIF